MHKYQRESGKWKYYSHQQGQRSEQCHSPAAYLYWVFEKNPQQWIYKGDEPSVIDFYADWCGPCKRVAPIMDEMAKKYNGKVRFYKVNVDKENKLASVFNIRSIPAVLFIPKKGKPLMQVGLLPHSTYVKIIDEHLLLKKPQTKKQ